MSIHSGATIMRAGFARARIRAGLAAANHGAQHSLLTNEQNMIEGNPMLALERGEKVVALPALWIQSTNDLIHDYRDPDSGFPGTEAARFVANYRRAGGEIALEYYDAPLHFTTEHPTMPQSIAAMQRVVAFVHEQMPV